MRRCVGWLVVVCCAAWAASTPAPAQESKPAENEVTRLIAQYELREQIWSQSTTAEGELDREHAPANEFMPKFKALAEKYAGQPPALEVLTWMLENASGGPGTDDAANAKWAVGRLARDHAADPAIREVLMRVIAMSGAVEQASLLELYDRVMAKNPDKETVATAAFGKGMLLMRSAEPGESNEKERTAKRAQALELFRKAAQNAPGTLIAKYAEGYTFEAEKLQIGMKAPDISGMDAEGKELRLAQYRGRVVVLDFWGFW